MTLLELYEKLCTGETEMMTGLCFEINWEFGEDLGNEFSEIMCAEIKSGYLPNKGEMTPERETFLLLFAAYKGQL